MLAVGHSIGNYVVRSLLGEGGMGMVYLAEHPLIGKRVAVKVIHPELANNRDAVSRFFTEAQAVNRIGHPNIVDITDFGQTTQGESYFVMELLAGESLSDTIKRQGGRLPILDALHIAEQVADALGASHAAGILHRDLKPDNIFLVTRGHDRQFVKVLDFGLAKLTHGSEQVSHRTRTGSVMGTPYYMAPEQCAGKSDIDARADVYALGVILFEMLTGSVPFLGEGYGEIIVKHMTQQAPRVWPLRPDCPPWLDELVARTLVKERKERVQSMEELRATIDSCLEGAALPKPRKPTSHPSLFEVPQAKKRRQIAMALALAGGLAVAGGGAALVLTGGSEKTPALPPSASTTPPPPPSPSPSPAPSAAPAPAPAPTTSPSPSPSPSTTTSTSTSTSTPPVAAPAPAKPAPPPAAKPPSRVAIRFESDPTGAAVVLEDGTELGKTPLDWKVTPSDRSVLVTFKKDGYEPRTEKVTPRQAASVKVDLSRVRRAAKPEPRPAPTRLDPKHFPTSEPPILLPPKPEPAKPEPAKPEPPKQKPPEDDLMTPGG